MGIQIPPIEYVGVNELKIVEEQPKSVDLRKLEALKESMRKWGFVVPIIANKDLVIADGEQRLRAAIELGMSVIPVIRLQVDDIDMQTLRHVLNKTQAEGKRIRVELPEDYHYLLSKSEKEIDAFIEDKPKAMKIWKLLHDDPEVKACWDMSDYIAVKKLHFNDHGETHAKICAATALKMLTILLKTGIQTDIIMDRVGDVDDLYLVVLVSALLHDIGNQMYRVEHSLHSSYLAVPILNRLLPEVYDDVGHWVELRGFILHAIFTHDPELQNFTVESAIINIADGTDMTKGRGRLPFDLGNANIHTVSALSIENVNVSEGKEKPIRIEIEMSNSAGIFQIQETLCERIRESPIEEYIEIVGVTIPPGEKKDRRIISRITFDKGKYLVH